MWLIWTFSFIFLCLKCKCTNMMSVNKIKQMSYNFCTKILRMSDFIFLILKKMSLIFKTFPPQDISLHQNCPFLYQQLSCLAHLFWNPISCFYSEYQKISCFVLFFDIDTACQGYIVTSNVNSAIQQHWNSATSFCICYWISAIFKLELSWLIFFSFSH